MAKVAVSSTVFGRTDLQSLCRTAVEAGLPGLEFSRNIQFLEDDRLANIFGLYRDQIDLLVPKFFLALKERFVLGLSLKHHWGRSLEHCRRAIDLCQAHQLKQYSLHAGLAIDLAPGDLGGHQEKLTAVDFDESRGNFFEACQQAADHAHRKGVGLLIENNVVAGYNCPAGINRRYKPIWKSCPRLLISLLNTASVSCWMLGICRYRRKRWVVNFKRNCWGLSPLYQR